jgi:predicted ABC-class ATPase
MSGRTIVPFKALYALLEYLPSFIERHLLASVLDLDDVLNFVTCIEDQEWIRSRLCEKGTVYGG